VVEGRVAGAAGAACAAAWCTGFGVVAGVAAGFAADAEAVTAAAGAALDESECSAVSPVEMLSTADAGVTVAVVTVVAESADATVLSDFAASRCAQAVAKLRTLPTSIARPTRAIDEDTESSKQRFINMLFCSCTLP
jgi:hypothetical protein